MTRYFGRATSRVDGPDKVTGKAKYAAEFNEAGLAYGSVVSASIVRGRIVAIDSGAALALRGVIGVLTHENRPHMADSDDAYMDELAQASPFGKPYRPLYDANILFCGQPVALVVAESSEIARHAASLIVIQYAEEPFVTDLASNRDDLVTLSGDTFALSPSKPRGDTAAAFAGAPIQLEAEYFIPSEYHNPMELFGTTVAWEGDGKFTVFDKTQGVQNVQRYLCSVFEMRSEDVRVMSPFAGGAFGVGLRPQYNVVLAMLAAQKWQRSVRVVLTRPQMYSLGYRPGTFERLTIGAERDGSLVALEHEAIAMASRDENFARKDTIWAGLLYKCPNTLFTHKLAKLDVGSPADMRAPGAATGVFALECAMDELAVALEMDPLELRLKNYSDRDQNTGLPYTSKALLECYRRGADAFGWEHRNPTPRSMRDGGDLIGMGLATGVWEALEMPFTARIVLTADGNADVSCGATDIGTGTYTVMAQVAADELGLPIERVTAKLGDSTLPKAAIEGGSWTAASLANAIVAACEKVRSELLRLESAAPASRLAGLWTKDVCLEGGWIVSKRDDTQRVSVSDLMRRSGVKEIARDGTNKPGPQDTHARNSHAAVFAEVRVDEQLGVVRVARVVSAVAAGRIINPKTAENQVLGSVVMGIGMALHEEAVTDHRFGRIMNANFAEYHVPVHADVHDIGVIFVDEPDTFINPLGAKGVGEIGLVGTPAAIANAIYHATGARVRDLPITLDKLNRMEAL